MSVSTETARVQYTLTSLGQTLTVPWYFLEPTHLGVKNGETDLTLNTHYTVLSTGTPTGTHGSIKLLPAAAQIGDTITLYRNGPFVQPTAYPLAGQLPAATIEEDEDRDRMLDQQLRLHTERSLRVSITKPPLPPLKGTPKEDSVLGFDDAGNPVVWDKDAFKGDKGDKGDAGKDGVDGKDAPVPEGIYSVTLTNESHAISCTPDGTPIAGELGFDGRAQTEVLAFISAYALTLTTGAATSGKYSFTQSVVEGVANVQVVANRLYIESIGSDAVAIEVQVSCEGNSLVKKRWTIAKVHSGNDGDPGTNGEDARVTWVQLSAATMLRQQGGSYIPPEIEVDAITKLGAAEPAPLNPVSLVIEERIGGAWVQKYADPNYSGTGKVFTPTNPSSVAIRFKLYAAAGTSELLDEQIVPVTFEAPAGPPGPKGEDGAAGTHYWLELDAAAVKKASNGTLTPTQVNIRCLKRRGDGVPEIINPCALKIEQYVNNNWEVEWSSLNHDGLGYRAPVAGATMVKFSLYKAGAYSELLDQQIVPVVLDGTSPQAPPAPPPPPPNYTLSFESVSGVSYTGGGTYLGGTNRSITCTVTAAGKEFDKWEVLTGSSAWVSNVYSASTSVTMNGNVKLRAKLKNKPVPKYSLTIWGAAYMFGGSWQIHPIPGGPSIFDAGTTFYITTKFNVPYYVDDWGNANSMGPYVFDGFSGEGVTNGANLDGAQITMDKDKTIYAYYNFMY